MADQELTFSQQGAVNWDYCASKTLSYTFNLLGRLSTRGVDVYTVTVAQFGIGSQFALSAIGYERLDEAMRKASYFTSFTKTLYFGVSIEHVTRQLAKTKQGQNFMVLANCLTEIFDYEFSGKVMVKIFEDLFPKEKQVPSTAQWASLLTSTSGILAPTHFAKHVETFMSYYDPEDFKDGRRRRQGDPNDIAHALVTLFKMCQRDRDNNKSPQLTQITLRGGASCGFLAAFGYYFLGLDVQLWRLPRTRGRKNKENPMLLFESNSKLETPNIIVQYEYQRRGINQTTSTIADLALTETAKIRNTSFVIRDIYDVVRTPVKVRKRRFIDPIIGGTIEWKKLLTEGFPVAGGVLLREGEIFGLFIGYTAKLLEYAAKNNQTSQFNIVRLSPEQYGLRYIENALRYFPELKKYEIPMRKGFSSTALKAIEGYRRICGELDAKLEKEGACNITHYLVIYLIWAFSSMVIADGLLPSKKGLLSMGFEEINLRMPQYPDRDDSPDGTFNKPAIVLYHPRQWGEEEFLKWSMTEILVPESAMYTAICLFGGGRGIPDGMGEMTKGCRLFYAGNNRRHDSLAGISSCCIKGITFVYGILKEISEDPFIAGRVHVIPGSIETEAGHSYFEIIDPLESKLNSSESMRGWGLTDSESDSDDSSTVSSDKGNMPISVVKDEKLQADTEKANKGEATGKINERYSERVRMLRYALGLIPGVEALATEPDTQDPDGKAPKRHDANSLLKCMLKRAERFQYTDKRNARIVITETPGQLHRLSLTIDYPTATLGSYTLLRKLFYGNNHPASFSSSRDKPYQRSYSVRRLSVMDINGGCRDRSGVVSCGDRKLDWSLLPFSIPIITRDPSGRGLEIIMGSTHSPASTSEVQRNQLFIAPTLSIAKNDISIGSLRSEALAKVDEIEGDLGPSPSNIFTPGSPVFDQIFVRESGCVTCCIAKISEVILANNAAEARALFFQSVAFEPNLQLSECIPSSWTTRLQTPESTSILLRSSPFSSSTSARHRNEPAGPCNYDETSPMQLDVDFTYSDEIPNLTSEPLSPGNSTVGSVVNIKYQEDEEDDSGRSICSSSGLVRHPTGININGIPSLDPKYFSSELRELLEVDDEGNVRNARTRDEKELGCTNADTEFYIHCKRLYFEERTKIGKAYLLIL